MPVNPRRVWMLFNFRFQVPVRDVWYAADSTYGLDERMSTTIGANYPTVVRIDTSVRESEGTQPAVSAPALRPPQDLRAGRTIVPPKAFKLKPVVENFNWKRARRVTKACAIFGGAGAVPGLGAALNAAFMLRTMESKDAMSTRDKLVVAGLGFFGMVANGAGEMSLNGPLQLTSGLSFAHPYLALAAAGLAAVGIALVHLKNAK